MEVTGSVPHVMSRRLVRLAPSAAAVGILAAPVAASAGPLTPPSALTTQATLEFAADGFPQKNVLPVWPDNPNDASANVGDIPYDEIAPKLNALHAVSD